MSNGICERQNRKTNLTRLAAQRQLYRDINNTEVYNVILTVVIPIGLAIVQEFIGWVKTICCIVSLIMLVLSFVIDCWQKNKKILAATIQQEFDLDVFTMQWDCKLFGVRKNVNAEIAKSSKKIISDENEKRALKNWYRKEINKMSLEEGIAACQKENFIWDAGLRKRYRLFLVIILALIIGIPLIIGLVKHELLQEYLFRLIASSSALKWIIKTIVGINADLNRMKTIEHSVCSIEKKTMENLAFTQKYIYDNRKVVIKIPDWFYKIFKNNDEDLERRALEINS